MGVSLDIDNTAEAWGETLLKLADEARTDAAARDTDSKLGMFLDDLSRVMEAYAARLGVERPVARAEKEPQEPQEPQDASLNPTETQEALAPDDAPAPPFVLPGWIRETLNNHHDRIEALDERVARLGDALHDALARIAWLEQNAHQSSVAIPPEYAPEPALDPDDYNPDAWGSIERARGALGKQVQREHRRLAGLRQQVLNAVIALTDAPDLTDDDRAQLAQHRARADRLDQIDSVRDVKLDEIAGLDDLNQAKVYRADVGWPR